MDWRMFLGGPCWRKLGQDLILSTLLTQTPREFIRGRCMELEQALCRIVQTDNLFLVLGSMSGLITLWLDLGIKELVVGGE